MRHFTILGAGGTIGSALSQALQIRGHSVEAITRATLAAHLRDRRPAGHVIDCIGLTGDFRARPLETAEAHVGVTARCLAELTFESFLFLSSTRVYAGAAVTHEAAALSCRPGDPSDLYNLTKLAGEALCLSDLRESVRVVRLSNVYAAGPASDTFLGQVIQEGQATGRVLFHQAPNSAKDYVSLSDVLRFLPRIATDGRDRLYNLASGRNTTHAAIAAILRDEVGWCTRFQPDARALCFAPIEIARLVAEFGPPLSNISADLPSIAGRQEVSCLPSTRQAAA